MTVNILTATDELINDCLRSAGVQESYITKTACQAVAERTEPWQQETLVRLLEAMFATIHENWKKNERPISRENWRWQPKPEFAPENTSPEVTLERCIVRAGGDRWTNQVPTSSGLFGPYADRHRNVDLIFDQGGDRYEFIELKYNSNTPVSAAFEIIRNGLLFLFTRKLVGTNPYSPRGNRNLLRAKTVELVVLAPAKYYENFDLSHFERAVNEAISAYAAAEFGLAMTFKFKSFPDKFAWIVSTSMTKQQEEELRATIEKRGDVNWKNRNVGGHRRRSHSLRAPRSSRADH